MQLSIPTGTVTFLFTDIEGSARMWERMPDAMGAELAEHDRLLREAIENNSGYVFKTVGDAFCAAFSQPTNALQAAIAAQRALYARGDETNAPLRVRMAIHTGTAQLRDRDYFGPELNRVSRLLTIVRGGQIFLSQASAELMRDTLPEGVALVPLGAFQLKDIARSLTAFQVHFAGMEAILGAVAPGAQSPSNLPVEMSVFVGRGAELKRVAALFDTHRMITLVGPGGVGKTRLALRAAHEHRERMTAGTWLVELVGVRGGDDVVPLVCATLGTSPQSDAVTMIAHALNVGPAILVLDNCEHVLDSTRLLARKLVETCPQLTILATSREPLHFAGEQIVEVSPLAVPRENASVEELLRSDAVALVLNRVSSWGTFEIDEGNAAAIGALCRRLDGIPLALELASARIRTLSPGQILERLDRRFALLTGGDRTGPSHHVTLERAIDWSYEQLERREQCLYRRLTVFEAPFTLDAAEAVCSGEPLELSDVLDLLTQLADKSFIRSDPNAGKWHMLETMRAYARERLDEQELPALRMRHLAFVLARTQRDHADAAENARWLNEMEAMLPDIRAAAEFAAGNEPERALQLSFATRSFWHIRGYYRLGFGLLRSAADANSANTAAAHDRAMVFIAVSTLANALGRHDDAIRAVGEARDLFASLRDQGGLANATNTLGNIASSRGEIAEARQFFAEALELFESNGDWGKSAMPLANLGLLAMDAQAYDEAETRLNEAASRCERANDTRVLAWVEGAIGELASTRGDSTKAKQHYERWLELSRSLGDKASVCTALSHLAELCLDDASHGNPQPLLLESLEIASEQALLIPLSDTLASVAQMLVSRGDIKVGAQLVGACDALREGLTQTVRAAERGRHDALSFAAKTRDEAAFNAGYAQGRAAKTEAAVQLARSVLVNTTE